MKIRSAISCGVIALVSVISNDAFADKKPEYKSKLSGYEFGVGVPLVTPLTGYNFFVGYVNKNAGTFWGRRFGIRGDFTIPTTLHATGTISDYDKLSTKGKPQYIIDGEARVLGFTLKPSDFSDKDLTMEAFEADDHNYVSIGKNAIDASLSVKHKNMGVLVDFYPFGDTWFLGGIRFSGGYYLGDLDISANAKINNDIDYRYKVGHSGDFLRAQIQSGSTIGANFHWKYHGPYAGFGFDLGIWRGFKFFMDAGVVFANKPHVDTSNIDDQHFVIKGCYEVNGAVCSDDGLITIMEGANKPVVRNIVQNTVGQAVKSILTSDAVAEHPKYNAVVSKIEAVSGLNFSDVPVADLADDVINFLDNNGEAAWIHTLIDENGGSELRNTITDIKSQWAEVSDDATDGIQKDINKAWQDYEKGRDDALHDINKFFDDYGVVPMVKIGFMYRF